MTTAAQRSYFGKALVELGRARQDIVVLDADLATSTKTSDFASAFPDRFFEVGIAEQNMIGTAAGLAACGKTVFASTFAVFATGRCWDQIRQSIAYPGMNVKVVSTHCGISVGGDGASHQALEDLSLMRTMPNMTVISPADAEEAFKATLAMADWHGPCYMRMGRADFPLITGKEDEFQIGKANIMKEGKDVSIVATGQMVALALDAARILKEGGVNAEVVNMSTLKPLDTETLADSLARTRCVVTAEEHSIIGGLGSAVAEYLAENENYPLLRVGVKDSFGESGTPDELMHKYGLTAENIALSAKMVIGKKTKKRKGFLWRK
ncbi:MAG: transketolase family protein [Candidatus Methanomethylophilaceae archaeon]|nr:transketolase family protein [Candidatus Methanomethylophilaceae archaeon]